MTPIRIIAILAAMAGAYLAAWQTSGSHVSGALGALAVLALALPSPVIKPKAGVLLALLLPLGLIACGPTTWQGAVLRTADYTRQATAKTVPDLLAMQGRKELGDCEAKHGEGSATCKPIALRILARLKVWQDKVRPAARVFIKALKALYDGFRPGAPPRVAPLRPVPARVRPAARAGGTP